MSRKACHQGISEERIQLQLPTELKEQLDLLAPKYKCSRNALIRQLCRMGIEQLLNPGDKPQAQTLLENWGMSFRDDINLPGYIKD